MVSNHMSRVERRAFLKSAAAGTSVGLAGCLGSAGSTGEYPSEPITLIVPYAEGGGIDTYARIISGPLSSELGVEVRVSNIPGETPIPGLNRLVTKPEDSYQIGMVGHPGLVGTALIYASWAPSILTPVGTAGKVIVSCYGNRKYNWKGLTDMINRFNSGEFEQVASIGFGTPFHVTGLLARKRANWNWKTWVPYPGAAPSIQAVIQDEVPFGVIASVTLQPHYQTDTKIDIIGTFASDGDPTMPKVQSWGEAGLPSVNVAANILVSMFGPPEMPQEHQQTLNEALQTAMKSKAVAKQREKTGLLIDNYATPDELRQRISRLEQEIDELINFD